MNELIDEPLFFHKSLHDLLDFFKNTISSTLWLKVSLKDAENYFQNYPYIVVFDSSVTRKQIKVDKSILRFIEEEGFNAETPLFSQTLANVCRVITITAKDILWEEPDFQDYLQTDELKFLKHLRNASAHNNLFYFGKGKEREKTLRHLPLSWRGKTVDKTTEGKSLFFDFINAADLMILLSDISNLPKKDCTK